jgi:hypothetical protein
VWRQYGEAGCGGSEGGLLVRQERLGGNEVGFGGREEGLGGRVEGLGGSDG